MCIRDRLITRRDDPMALVGATMLAAAEREILAAELDHIEAAEREG